MLRCFEDLAETEEFLQNDGNLPCHGPVPLCSKFARLFRVPGIKYSGYVSPWSNPTIWCVVHTNAHNNWLNYFLSVDEKVDGSEMRRFLKEIGNIGGWKSSTWLCP